MSPRRFFPALAWCLAGCGSEPGAWPEPVREAAQAATVDEVLGTTCTTSSVKGLSEQIVAQSNCIAPGAFVAVPDQPNVTMGMTVFPYLEEPARDAFVAAAEADPGTTLGVNSMLRTVAQQYLLYAWYVAGSCGIGLAAEPGNSNHETGLAFDTSDYTIWKSTLSDHGFAWLGNSDPVHFDYAGPGATSYKGTDVLAFQQLWNANHPDDAIAEDGDYGPQTAARLGASPADGFLQGAECATPAAGPDLYPSLDGAELGDRFSDGASADVPDLFVGDDADVAFTVENKGGASADEVTVGVDVAGDYLDVVDYAIETDRMHPGSFEVDAADADPANPPHGTTIGPEAKLRLGALVAGEKKRVRVTIHAKAYSLERGSTAPSAFVRGWVIELPGVYHQDSFDSVPETDGSQTYRGGQKLAASLPLDVYDHARWEWDTNRREGWEAAEGAVVGGGALALEAGLRLVGPMTALDADALRTIEIRLACTGAPPKVGFATDGGEPDDAHVFAVDVPADGAAHDVTIDARANPAWTGTVTQLALVAGGAASVEHLAVVVGPAAAVPDASDADADEGCACAAAGRPARGPAGGSFPMATLVIGFAVAAHVRRRAKATSC